MFKFFKKEEPVVEAPSVDTVNKELVYNALKVLSDVMEQKRATKSDLCTAINEAIGYLGQITVD